MTRRRSKTLATWLALVAGAFGAHRFYLHGPRDVWAWLHPWPTFAGLAGVSRVLAYGQDDRVSWLLLPLLGLMLAQATLVAIVYGLTPDERWDARHNGGQAGRASGWGAVLGVVAAVFVGATALMSSVAFGTQRFFEWQMEQAQVKR